MTGNVRRFVCAFALALVLPSCGGGGGSTPTTPSTPAAPTITGVTVTGATSPATVGQTAQFSATANLSNSTTQSVTSQASWQSSNGGVASVSSAGLVTAVSAGDADIRATYSGATGSAHVTVTAPAPAPGPAPSPSGFSLSGRVTEEGTSSGVADVTVEVKDRSIATTTNSAGNYTLTGISAGSYTIRGTKGGYEIAERAVSMSASTTLDFTIKKVPSSPPPTPAPATCGPRTGPCGQATAVCNDGSVSCSANRSGTCSSHKGVECWICPGTLCNGLTAPGGGLVNYSRVPLPALPPDLEK